MCNGKNVIGLFQGMFEGNVLIFNFGWDQDCYLLELFMLVQEIELVFIDVGVIFIKKIKLGFIGLDSIVMFDFDGNVILIDQYV